MLFNIDRNNLRLCMRFTTRALILSLPLAALFFSFVYLELVPPFGAGLCFLAALVSNIFLIFPISSELNTLRKYIASLAQGETDYQMDLSDKDTRDLAKAISTIHKVWLSKTDTLEAQTLSDAAVFDTLPDPILMLDSEGNITNTNLAAKKMLGNSVVSHSIDRIFSTNIFIASVEKVLKCKNDS